MHRSIGNGRNSNIISYINKYLKLLYPQLKNNSKRQSLTRWTNNKVQAHRMYLKTPALYEASSGQTLNQPNYRYQIWREDNPPSLAVLMKWWIILKIAVLASGESGPRDRVSNKWQRYRITLLINWTTRCVLYLSVFRNSLFIAELKPVNTAGI